MWRFEQGDEPDWSPQMRRFLRAQQGRNVRLYKVRGVGAPTSSALTGARITDDQQYRVVDMAQPLINEITGAWLYDENTGQLLTVGPGPPLGSPLSTIVRVID